MSTGYWPSATVSPPSWYATIRSTACCRLCEVARCSRPDRDQAGERWSPAARPSTRGWSLVGVERLVRGRATARLGAYRTARHGWRLAWWAGCGGSGGDVGRDSPWVAPGGCGCLLCWRQPGWSLGADYRLGDPGRNPEPSRRCRRGPPPVHHPADTQSRPASPSPASGPTRRSGQRSPGRDLREPQPSGWQPDCSPPGSALGPAGFTPATGGQ